MTKESIWMVRAGRGATYIDDFVEGGYVAIGWNIPDDFGDHPDKADLVPKLQSVYPNQGDGTIAVWAAQIARYFNELSIGDAVATYDPNNRLYYFGEILTGVTVHNHQLKWMRKVRWDKQVPRDSLQASTRNSLGSISTLFLIRGEAAADMRANMAAIGTEVTPSPVSPKPPPNPKSADSRELLEEAMSRSAEFIEDRIAALSWEQM